MGNDKNKGVAYVNPNGKITDYFGFELKPGDIVIHGYRGQKFGEPFSVGVYVKENERTVTIAKNGRKWNRKTNTIEEVVKKIAIGKSYGVLIQPLVIVSNPLFSLNNKYICQAIEIIDTLKSRGELPADFEAGVTNALENEDD